MGEKAQLMSSVDAKGVRFWLEGGRLCYRASQGMLTHEELAMLRDLRDEMVSVLSESQSLAAATYYQEGSVGPIRGESFENQLITTALRISGELNVELLRKSLEVVIHRHESLRTKVVRVGGGAKQLIDNPTELRLRVESCSSSDTLSEVRSSITEFFDQWLDVTTDPLLQIRLIKLSDFEHALAIAVHHSVSDGASNAIFFRELWGLYGEFVYRRPASLPSLYKQCADYAVWQRQAHLRMGEENEKYWMNRLDGATRVRLPADSGLEDIEPHTAEPWQISFDKPLSSAIYSVARSQGTIPALVLVAAYVVVVSQRCNRKDILVPFTISGRVTPEHDYITGSLISGLILRVTLTGNETFHDVLGLVVGEFASAWEHMDLKIVSRRLAGEQELISGGVLQWLPWQQSEIQGVPGPALADCFNPTLRVEPFFVRPDLWVRDKTSFDFVMHFFKGPDGIIARGRYRADLFKRETMTRFSRDLQLSVMQMVRNPSERVASFHARIEALGS